MKLFEDGNIETVVDVALVSEAMLLSLLLWPVPSLALLSIDLDEIAAPKLPLLLPLLLLLNEKKIVNGW